ncbi:MAG: OmpA family protein [Candidatus Eisenbacteria bacterium]|nr:OmpA family protein [Candidatus Eisenbacteria bacterium]
MRARLWLLPLLATAVFGVGAAVAEPIGAHWELSPFGGFTLFDPKLRYPGSNVPLADDLYLGGRLSYETRSWIGLELAAGTTPTAEDLASGALGYDFFHASGNLVISPAKRRWGTPYAFVGGGYAQLKPSSGEKRETGSIEFGGGVKLWMTDGVGLRFEARDISFKPLENLGPQNHFHNVVLGAGLTLALGATPRDTDGDGVPDRRDKCPATPKGATVDATGCPKDSDGDGVFDGLDKCPDTPKGATVDASGCPSDADGDGVFDGIDKCPDTPKGATVDATGCPKDSDGDGVLDGLDKCPNTPTGAKIDSTGCPVDSDGDGVYDGLDKCPNTPAGLKVDSDGCPIMVSERETELLDTGLIRLQDVNFETGKANLLPDAYPALDAVGAVMLKWPQLRIEVGGHTDSRGSEGLNQRLSQARADSVLAYMLRKYPALPPAQFTVKGYGESKPLVPNTNDLNRAKNRRVEFTVINKEVLKKEVEKRRLLKESEGSAAPAPTPAPADTTKKQ